MFLPSTASWLLNSKPIAVQFVRFIRKPRWIPVAKSKKFRIPVHPPQSDDEKKELLRLHNNYRTQTRSIRLFLINEVENQKKMSSADHLILSPEQQEKEYSQILNINEVWNKRCAMDRDDRLRKNEEEKKVYVKERLEMAMEKSIAKEERIKEIVKTAKENSSTFITRDKMDEVIETAMANVIVYNKPIDLSKDLKSKIEKK